VGRSPANWDNEVKRFDGLARATHPTVDLNEFSAQMEGFPGADIESLCKKANFPPVEFQNGTRQAPFFVLRSDL
jgi:SpoVK/Ycf46/Vps4 family AAA+-type ATPase